MRSALSSTLRTRRFLATGAMLLVVTAASVAAMAQSARATVTTLATFSNPGPYVWTVPTGVTSVTFDVFGASGGNVVAVHNGVLTVVASGGVGGEAKGRFPVHAGERFEILVGGQGGTGTVGSTTTPIIGGFDGGGGVAVGDVAGAGGGASDVRIGGDGDGCVGGKACGFPDRIVVGGGGGGAADSSGDNGGSGGGLVGGGFDFGIKSGGTQESSGLGCGISGRFGMGADAPPPSSVWGGGGGGWYGGCSSGSGGGGSGYVSRFSTSGSFPGGTNVGDGRVIITTP